MRRSIRYLIVATVLLLAASVASAQSPSDSQLIDLNALLQRLSETFSGASEAFAQTLPSNIQPELVYQWDTNMSKARTNDPADVTSLQQAFQLEGVYDGPVTGYFGKLTYKAAQEFQRKYGITGTGFVGIKTRTQLNALYAEPDSDDSIDSQVSSRVNISPVEVISPNGGEIWYHGDLMTLQWEGADIINSRIDLNILYDDMQSTYTIATLLFNDGSSSWLVPSDLPAGELWLEVICRINCGEIDRDVSDRPFHILAFSGERGLPPIQLSEKWIASVEASALPRRATPAIDSGGNIYVASNQTLYAFSENGVPLWTYAFPEVFFWSDPTIGTDGTIYFSATDKGIADYSRLYAIAPDGTEKWSVIPSDIFYESPTPSCSISMLLSPLNEHGSVIWREAA